ncbi:hypothetical protein [Desulfobacula toluolica]|uniref:Conserved uncharacterized protein n=1 Tax=Desulfobacula toluolica (strain DSM 7467 / Tol2) TaxID=651182 RepID=K0NGZ8_DESTT|nr:hypothetical protein [Desulfobacula toluolica]CCK79123.1 conserved uncharacterized protein [Desulfobacula toluolica Tol2]
MIQKLSSIKFAFYNLVCLVCFMGAGVYLSRWYKNDFKVMNETLIFEWLKSAWSQTPVLVVWFALLCLSAGLLFVNTLCCSFTKQIQVARKSGKFEKWLFFVLHCLFIVVLACHGLILVVGHKQGNITLFSNSKMLFQNQYLIEVSDIVFKDDINILKAGKQEQRIMMTRDNIHRKQNFAIVSLYQASTLMETKKVMMLSPLRHGSIQVALTDFIVKKADNQERVGVKLTITDNPLNIFFFTIYALMILSLGGYIITISWGGRD